MSVSGEKRAAYQQHKEDWKRTLPEASDDELHEKALQHMDWQEGRVTGPGGMSSVEVPTLPATVIPAPSISYRRELWAIIAILLALLLFPHRAHGQFSKITTITYQHSDNSQAAFYAAPFIVKEGSNITFTRGSCPGADCGKVTIAASSTASTAFSALTASTNSNAGTFAVSGNTWDFSAAVLMKFRVGAGATTSVNGDVAYDSTAKAWHIWQNGHDYFAIAATNLGTLGQAFLSGADGSGTFADPIVSGATAIGSAPSTNPVFVATWDGTNIRVPLTQNSTPGGSDYALTVRNIPSGTQAVSGTFWQATQPVSAASLPLPTGAATESTLGTLDTDVKANITLHAGTNLIGEVAPVATAVTTDTTSRCTLISAASTNSTSCKGSAGNVYGYRFLNTTTTIYYLRMYNSSSAPTCSSATGFIETIPIPPAGSAGQAGGIVSMEPFGEGYSTGISFCLTGGSASTDNTNAATGIFGTILYK